MPHQNLYHSIAKSSTVLKWMDGWTDGRMHGQINGRTDIGKNGQMDGLMDKWTDGQMDRLTDGWMNEYNANLTMD